MMDDLYIELALNGVNSRGKLYKYNEVDFTALAKEYGPNNDCYRSVWLYDKEGYEYSKSNRKMSFFFGKRYIDEIPFDIDAGHDVAKDIYLRLKANSKIKIFFSGRGYHFIKQKIMQPGKRIIRRVQRHISKIVPGAKIDPTIYRMYSLWRLPHTINTKTNLYKIPLSEDELLNLSHKEIIELAKENRING